MAAPFPGEKPITPHDLIELAESGVFGGLDDALDDANTNLTRRDFDFTESCRASGHPGIVIARPKSGQGDHWACTEDDQEWLQRPGFDPSTQGLDTSTCPQPQAAPPPAPVQGAPPPFAASPARVGMRVRMTGDPRDEVPDVGNLGKGDGREFERKLDALFADIPDADKGS